MNNIMSMNGIRQSHVYYIGNKIRLNNWNSASACTLKDTRHYKHDRTTSGELSINHVWKFSFGSLYFLTRVLMSSISCAYYINTIYGTFEAPRMVSLDTNK